jgi:AraC-like DNA-binding protein
MLEHYPAVDTADAEAAREQLIRIYGADRADIRGGAGNSVLHANHLQMRDIAVSYCEYGVDARVEFPEASYVRQIFKISGKAQTSADARVFNISRQEWTALIPAQKRFGLSATPDYQQLVLRLELDALRRAAHALVGEGSDRDLVFSDTVDFESPAARSLRRRVFFFAGEFDVMGGYFSDLAAAEIEKTLIVNFLFCHRHTYTDRFLREPLPVTASSVRRVEEYIEANWDRPLDVETLAAIANVSARSVFRQFKKSRGYSPLTFVKKIRLGKARALLLGADPQATVTSIALKCGFQNVGHFASDYRLEFRELPSETLARSRC